MQVAYNLENIVADFPDVPTGYSWEIRETFAYKQRSPFHTVALVKTVPVSTFWQALKLFKGPRLKTVTVGFSVLGYYLSSQPSEAAVRVEFGQAARFALIEAFPDLEPTGSN